MTAWSFTDNCKIFGSNVFKKESQNKEEKKQDTRTKENLHESQQNATLFSDQQKKTNIAHLFWIKTFQSNR